MGEILMPPNLWFANDESTPGPKRLVDEDNEESTPRNKNQESTSDLRQRGLVGEYNSIKPSTSTQQYNQYHIHSSIPDLQSRGSFGEYIHSDLNVLMQSRTYQNQRSIIINEYTIRNRRAIINDDFQKKKNVFERLGSSTTNRPKENYNAKNEERNQQDKHRTHTSDQPRTYAKVTDSHYPHPNNQQPTGYNKQHDRQRDDKNDNFDRGYNKDHHQQYKSNPNSNYTESHHQNKQYKSRLHTYQEGSSEQQHRSYQHNESNRDKNSRVPERYGREEMGKDAHKRDTSRQSRNSYNQDQGMSAKFYNNLRAQNNTQPSSYNNSKCSHSQDRAEPAKRPHVEIQSNNNRSTLPHA